MLALACADPEGPTTPASANAPAAGTGAAVWGVEYFQNATLVDHTGKEVKFFDDLVKDKVVAINFIYTSCPDACPMETARMLDVYRILGDRVGKDVHFYSITIDPDYDTPEVLAEYRNRWGIGDGWTFLTGKNEDILALRKKFGLLLPASQKEGENDHNISLMIGNQSTGRWMKRSPYENPYVLADQLGSWLHNWKQPRQNDRPYNEAPVVRNITEGENLWRTRCQSCHTIGYGKSPEVPYSKVGPDLYGVHQNRDPAWLRRWLREPDVMLAEGDPIGTALLAAANEIPMPNLRLTDIEIELLIEYITEETSYVDRLAAYSASQSATDLHH